ncbi:MAG: hypothetical protein ABEK04_01470 [Candidatus Nanohalobium sp.]
MTAEEDVIDDYLVWEICKQRGVKKEIIEGSMNEEELKEEVVEVRKEYQERHYDLEGKIDQVRRLSSNPDHKVKVFEYCSWDTETVKVEDLGTTLPHAMGLPPEVISGSLSEVMQFVREADPEKYRSVSYINSLKEVPEVLNQFSTTVVSPGSILRRQERMKKAYGVKNWNIQEVWGAVHDANHRTVAKIIANDLEEIECFVGRPSNDKIYDHVEP